MYNFNIGGGFLHFMAFQRLINILEFYDVPKDKYRFNFFDCPPNCKWEGGRHFRNDTFTKEQCDQMISYFNDRGYGFNFTFSNCYIDVNDKVGNYYLNKHHNALNGVVIANDELNNYIKEKYPLYKRIKSITAYPMPLSEKTNEQYFGKYLPEYDLVVAPAEMCRDKSFLETYKNDFEKIEFLINETCVPNCKFKKLHYKMNSIVNRERDNTLISNLPIFCILNQKNLKKLSKSELKNLKSLKLSSEELNNLISMGALNFKISGRIPNFGLENEMIKYIFPLFNISEMAWFSESLGLMGGGQIDETVEKFNNEIQKIIKEYEGDK